MPMPGYILPVIRKVPVFLLVEKGNELRMPRIKNIINGILDGLKAIEYDAEAFLAVYTFSSTDTCFASERLINVCDFDIDSVFEKMNVDLTHVFNRLNENVTREKMFNGDISRADLPIIILLTEGNKNYYGKDALEKLQENKWFRDSIKLVITNTTNNIELFERFAETKEGIITFDMVEKSDIIKHFIKAIEITGDIISEHDSADENIVKVDPISEDDNDVDGWL